MHFPKLSDPIVIDWLHVQFFFGSLEHVVAVPLLVVILEVYIWMIPTISLTVYSENCIIFVHLQNLFKVLIYVVINNRCYICLAEYEEGETIRVLPCCHEYHMPCIDKWLKEIHGYLQCFHAFILSFYWSLLYKLSSIIF